MSAVRSIVLGVLRSRGRILVGPGFDDVTNQRFFRPLGGEIGPGETAAEALHREIHEETGLRIENLSQLGVLENRFEYRGQPGHELVTVLDASFADASVYDRDWIPLTEPVWEGVAIWLDPREPLPAPLVPAGLPELLQGESVSVVRMATEDDIPQMQRVRGSVRENVLSPNTVITRAMYRQHLGEIGRGWVYEIQGRIVGLSFANLRDASIWALFVEPGYEGRGIGRALHDTMLDWMRSEGTTRVRLGTDPVSRAARFYETAGWERRGIDERGEAIYERDL